jgi:hypothetical protein
MSGLISSSDSDEVSQSDFLELFVIPGKPKWTRDVALYDALPKYLFSSTRNKKMAKIDADSYREIPVEIGKTSWRLSLTPAHVPAGDKSFFAFPGEREELVARALRYLAVQKSVHSKLESLNGQRQLMVFFTLYQIREALAHWNHTYDSVEIDEALRILRATGMTLTMQDSRKAFYSGSLLAGYSGVDLAEDDRSRQRWVILNSLEVDSIVRGDFRALNFQRMMSLKSPLARSIFDLVMRQHRNAQKPSNDSQAKPPPGFDLRLGDVLTYCGIVAEKTLRNTIRRVRSALDELATNGMLWPAKPYEEFPVYEHRTSGAGRRKVIDVLWVLYLSKEEVSDMIASHTEASYGGKEGENLPFIREDKKAEMRKAARDKQL